MNLLNKNYENFYTMKGNAKIARAKVNTNATAIT